MEPGTVMLASAGLHALGGLFQGFAQGKVSEQQLEMARLQHGLSREQFEFMKQQALRQNQIGQANTDRVSPLLMQMLVRARENMNVRPEPVRLSPPNINNRYQPGVGSAGNPAPPPTPQMPWLQGTTPPAAPQPTEETAVPVSPPPMQQAPAAVAPSSPAPQDPREMVRRMILMMKQQPRMA